MKHVLSLLLTCYILQAGAQLPGTDNRLLNEFIVLVKPGHTVKEVTAAYPSLTVKRNLSQRMNIWLLERNTTNDAETFLLSLQRNEHVKLAQFNHYYQQRSVVIPNDTLFGMQWNMLNTGQMPNSIAGADIDATQAWEINHSNLTVNGDTIVVAVIDVSFDYNHEDINFYRNYQEVPNNSVDDDGNGYIDDYEGWNAYQSNGNINAFGTDPHSMHISGIVGAIGDNHIGVAGVCWGAKVLRICASGNREDIAVAAYDYIITMRSLYNNTAGAKGAFIVASNTSFGVDKGNPQDYPIWCAMYDSMGAVGVLSAGATSNSIINVDQQFDIPTTCPSNWLIGVTSTNNRDVLQGAYGKTHIDLAAPGAGVFSTYSSNGYAYSSGTSMATPHVAGALAAMYAAACPRLADDYLAYPDSIALIIKQMLLNGAEHLSSLHNRTLTGARLNLHRALLNLQEYNCDSCGFEITTTTGQPTCSNTCDGSIEIDISGSTVFNFTQTNLCPGYYPVTLTDASGCTRVKYVELAKPDSINISSIQIIRPDTAAGNIIVVANAGQYDLTFSLDGINYQQTSILVIDSLGDYTVYVKNENGCVVERLVHVGPVGIGEAPSLTGWNLYPNPARDILHVMLDMENNTKTQFTISNLLGETIWQHSAELTAGANRLSIPLSAFQSGIYFLGIQAGGYTSKKFIVTR